MAPARYAGAVVDRDERGELLALPDSSAEQLRRALGGSVNVSLAPAPVADDGAGLAGAPAESALGVPAATATPSPPRRRRRRKAKVRPVFVVSLARSGSTLLRYLLDSHPEIVSPPELNLSALAQHVIVAWNRTNDALGAAPSGADDGALGLSPEVCERARRVVDEIMEACAEKAGAKVYVDKSLTTADHLPIVSACYPDATFIFLYRYPLDMIASGIEASRWGFQAYGFAPYVNANPQNFVGGLANYWADKVGRMVAFERTCTSPHARIYYELLCDDPRRTVSELFDFLDLEADDAVVERALATDHGRGPGDYKIDFTKEVSPESIGRGASLPQMMAPAQVARINELLAELDYPSLESGWRGDLASLLGLAHTGAGRSDASALAEELLRELSGRSADVPEQLRALLPADLVVKTGSGPDAWLEVGTDGRVGRGAPREDGTDGRARVRSVDDALVRVARGELNLAVAAHDGLIRVEQGTGEAGARWRAKDVMALLDAVLTGRG